MADLGTQPGKTNTPQAAKPHVAAPAAAPAAKKPAEAELVTMKDGRKVEFTGKAKMVKSHAVTNDGKVILRIDLRDGSTFSYKLPDKMLLQFAGHGAEQKFGDKATSVKGEGGAEADLEDVLLALEDLGKQIDNGEWTSKRESDGMAGTSILLKAIVKVTGKSVEGVKAFLATKSAKEKQHLAESDKFRDAVLAIKKERVKKADPDIAAKAVAGLDAIK